MLRPSLLSCMLRCSHCSPLHQTCHRTTHDCSALCFGTAVVGSARYISWESRHHYTVNSGQRYCSCIWIRSSGTQRAYRYLQSPPHRVWLLELCVNCLSELASQLPALSVLSMHRCDTCVPRALVHSSRASAQLLTFKGQDALMQK